MRTHAERTERFTKDGFDPSREALNYFRWSVERVQQARAEAVCARQCYEQLSSSSRHRSIHELIVEGLKTTSILPSEQPRSSQASQHQFLAPEGGHVPCVDFMTRLRGICAPEPGCFGPYPSTLT